MSFRKKTTRKVLSSAFLGTFCLFVFFSSVFLTKPDVAQAQADEVTVPFTYASCGAFAYSIITYNTCMASAKSNEEAQDRIKRPILQTALLSVLLNMATFVFDRLAYESAVAIATGGEGETPLISTYELKDAWSQFGLDIAGEAIGAISEDILDETFGIEFDLCAPDPLLQFSLALGIKQAYKPQAPRCDFRDIQANWQAFTAQTLETATNPTEAVVKAFADGLRPGQNELSASIALNIKIHEKILLEKKLRAMEQTKNEGWENIKEFITGQVETPANVLKNSFDKKLEQAEEKKIDLTMQAVLSNQNLLTSMFTHVSSTFTNTLLATTLNRIYEGFFQLPPPPDPFDNLGLYAPGREDIEEEFSRIISKNPISTEPYNALSEFATCTAGSDVTNRNVNNCVMDAGFVAAVSRADAGGSLTVQEAIDEGFLRGDWRLFSSSDKAQNADSFCYTYGYCYGNLVKLRKARIIPVGWEIAAERNAEGKTLQEIVNAFNDCTDSGTIDSGSNRFCHLIDPNWVLKYPETQCRAIASGEVLASSLGGLRASYCADTPSCLGENDDGQCDDGYGYCTREKNVWRFRGEECPVYYASCLSFENTNDGEQVDFLLNTVDQGTCNASNAGCRWYRVNKYLDLGANPVDSSDDTFVFLPGDETYVTSEREDDWRTSTSTRTTYAYTSPSGEVSSYQTYSYEDRMYFTNDVEECAPEAAGCTQLYRIGENLVLNNVTNPGFEADENGNGIPDSWQYSGTAGTYSTAGEAFTGARSFILEGASGGDLFQKEIQLSPNAFYTFSVYARGESAGASADFALDFENEVGAPVSFAGTSFSGSCIRSSHAIAGDSYELSATGLSQSDWSRHICTFTTLGEPIRMTITASAGAGNVRVDGFQVELGEFETLLTNEYNSIAPETSYLVIAPDYLGCTGSATDHPDCNAFTQACSAQEVGCERYTPKDGDPAVPAIVSSLDECPVECVGYDTFKQEATKYEQADFPLFFIPTAATACTASAVGCDSFTNLDTLEEGGEGIEYYTDLRACLTPDMADPNDAGKISASFFTWEGSDLAGYQLNTWQLLESNFSSAPCVGWRTSSQSEVRCVEDSVSTAEIAANESCDEHSDIFTNPDCREFYDTDGNIHYRQFSETVTVSDQCHPYRKTDPGTVLDCEGFGGFSAPGGECFSFGLPEESVACSSAENGCREYTGGAGRNAATVLNEMFETGTVAGFMDINSGAPSAISISNESVATGGHSLRTTVSGSGFGGFATLHAFDNPANPNETCEATGGCTGSTAFNSSLGTCTVTQGEESCGRLTSALVSGKTFVLEFWAKGSDDIVVGMVEEGGLGTYADFVRPTDETGSVVYAGLSGFNQLQPLPLSNNWQLYTLGPIDTSREEFAAFDENAVLAFAMNAGGGVGEFFVDNIRLKQVEENITIIKDSWVVPATCDTSPAGVTSPQYYLGCEAYTDTAGDDIYLYQFSNLCGEDAVGCEAFYNTHNSQTPATENFNVRCFYDGSNYDATAPTNSACQFSGEQVCVVGVGRNYCTFDWFGALPAVLPSNIVIGPEAVIVSNDSPVFLVDNGTTTCSVASMGCEEVGVPVYNQDKSEVTNFESAYLINLPARYEQILCDNEALFCEEWASTQDGNFYFKHPFDQTCEWRTTVTLANNTYFGWFRSGTEEPCYWTDLDGDGTFNINADDAFLVAGEEFSVWKNGDPAYVGWVAECTPANDRCSEFIDPTDRSLGTSPDGKKYYYIKNELLSEDGLNVTQKCNGQISRREGCGLFNDTTNTQLLYAAGPSYLSSTYADYLFGESRDSLQEPISCLNGGPEFTPAGQQASVNLCENFCMYTVGGTNLSVFGEVDSSDGINQYFGSCLFNTDCPVLLGTNSEDYSGTCVNAVEREQSLGLSPEAAEAYRYDNDTNDIIKVNRDRECAEWLTILGAKPTWDTRTNNYELISSSVSLCNDSTGSGDLAGCGNRIVSDPLALTPQLYADRDVSWTGLEYSGYSIPNRLPIDVLAPVANVHPDTTARICVLGNGTPELNNLGGYIQCENPDQDCDAGVRCREFEPDMRLAYKAGPCDQGESGWGGSCVTGFCESGGQTCAANSDCASGDSCVIGYCQVISSTSCTSDANCAGTSVGPTATNVCSPAGFCVDQLTPTTETCVSDASCSVGAATCTASALAKTGACYNNLCLTDTSGDMIVPVDAEASSCRGYPSASSPYPATKLVQEWTIPETGNRGTRSPFSLKFGFQGVEVCTPDEDGNINDGCVCSYDQANYGEGGATRFYPENTSETEVLTGICLGGGKAGYECEDDLDCGEGDTPGNCAILESKETVFGWEGLCLERDTSIQIWGSPNAKDRACLTWLPVDSIPGSTDLFGKATGAGQLIGERVEYCAEVELYFDAFVPYGEGGVHDDLSSAGATAKGDRDNPLVACADNERRCQAGTKTCFNNAVCPAGFFAIMSACSPGGAFQDNFAGACRVGLGHNDCPYICVPKNSFTTEGVSCDRTLIDRVGERVQKSGVNTASTYVFSLFDQEKEAGDSRAIGFDEVVVAFATCQTRGLEYNRVITDYTIPGSGTTGPSLIGYRGVGKTVSDGYPGCKSLVQVSAGNLREGNKAWTNRLWEDTSINDFTIWAGGDPNGLDEFLGYGFGTRFSPYGTSPIHTEAGNWFKNGDQLPFRPAYCTSRGVGALAFPELAYTCVTNPTFTAVGIGGAVGSKPTADALAKSDLPDEGRAFYFFDIVHEEGESAYCSSDSDCRSFTCGNNGNCNGGPLDGESCDTRADCNFGIFCDKSSPPNMVALTGVCVGTQFKRQVITHKIPFFPFVTETETDAIARLSQIFAKSQNLFEFDDQEIDVRDPSEPQSNRQARGEYEEVNFNASEWVWDVTSGFDSGHSIEAFTNGDSDELSAPVVLALGQCFDGVCWEGPEGTFTVNDKNFGIVPSGDGLLDVTASFYTYANKNQMPIRNIVIDWGAGDYETNTDIPWPTDTQDGSDTDDNFYPNYRGMKFPSRVNSICDDSEWGKTAESCEQNFVSFIYTYTCTDDDLVRLQSRTCQFDGDRLLNSPCTISGTECVFQPRVHVKDNWGWCTGTCNNPSGGAGNACYGDFECNITFCPSDDESGGTDPNCPDVSGDINNPWVNFGGTVRVTPD